MSNVVSEPSHAAPEPTTLLRRLLPPGAPATAEQVAAAFSFARPPSVDAPARPRVLLNMVSTIDGRATLGGRSGPIGNRADRQLFHALRGVVDAVMIGAGTARAERYGRLIREPSRRASRRARGLAEEPLACIVSGRLALSAEIPLLREPDARLAILTSSQASLAADAQIEAHIEYVRAERNGQLDLRAALAELHQRFGVGTVLCEGGPHLNAQLLAARLVDELFLSLSPKLAGGDTTTEVLRILAGADLEPPAELELLSVFENESHLFLRYGARDSPERTR